ncbi:mRNA-decapping enzyme-like protein [Vigna angularis]|uniref:mRNA-decapping enzyme-like protein n=1 Tax=Phaseolus angularis TaxID=3914 RepID=A0A8T0JEA7_PHAAN|nr:mRNA-decapping enzyme-like protein [Vigna angularis]
MSQNGKLMPNLDQHSTKLLNLTVLQRIDPFVEEILITAAHVTFYEFNIDLSQWVRSLSLSIFPSFLLFHSVLIALIAFQSRKDVEGSLFVVKRNTQPRFQFIVMNRRNTENLVENLLGDFEYEVQVPYLLYRNAAQEVNGIWFYNSRECEEVANLFSRILNAYAKVPPKSKVSSTKRIMFLPVVWCTAHACFKGICIDPAFDVDILGSIVAFSVSFVSIFMLLRIFLPSLYCSHFLEKGNFYCVTNSEFEELEAVPTMAVMDGPLEPPSSTASNVVDVPDDPSFVNFFSAAMAIGNTSNVPVTGQPYQSSATISSSSVQTHAATPTVPTLQIPPLSASTPPIPHHDVSESISSNRTTKLVKPSFFAPPPSSAMMIPPASSSTPTAPPLHPAVNVQRPYGAPLLQPFPPPNPPPSLAPAPSPNYSPVISREKVRDALLVLVQVSLLVWCLCDILCRDYSDLKWLTINSLIWSIERC